jgi:hypothetical protein
VGSLLVKRGMLCRVVVCAENFGFRMCKCSQWLACVGGWRDLVKISAVLLAEDTPPILIRPSASFAFQRVP